MFRRVSVICTVATAGLLAWAAYSALRSKPGPEPAFLVSPTEEVFGTVELGKHAVNFAITNPADRPRRIVGLAEG